MYDVYLLYSFSGFPLLCPLTLSFELLLVVDFPYHLLPIKIKTKIFHELGFRGALEGASIIFQRVVYGSDNQSCL